MSSTNWIANAGAGPEKSLILPPKEPIRPQAGVYEELSSLKSQIESEFDGLSVFLAGMRDELKREVKTAESQTAHKIALHKELMILAFNQQKEITEKKFGEVKEEQLRRWEVAIYVYGCTFGLNVLCLIYLIHKIK